MLCAICCSKDHEVVIDTGMSVCSGREILGGSLIKAMCVRCGFVKTLCSPIEGDYYKSKYSSKLRTKDYDYVNYEYGDTFTGVQKNFIVNREWPKVGSILDIGCGKGTLLKEFGKAYSGWHLYGVDPSPKSVEIARENNPEAHIDEGVFDPNLYTSGSFDLILLYAVLDRADNPRKFWKDAISLMKPGGRISVEVPIIDKAPFVLYFADHTCCFSFSHVITLADSLGLELLDVDPVGSKQRFLFKRKDGASPINYRYNSPEEIRALAKAWQALFDDINKRKDAGQKFAIYGYGTAFSILMAQSRILPSDIVGIYDDTPSKIGEKAFGFTLGPPDSRTNEADAVVLCAGPGGISIMKNKLGDTPTYIYLGSPHDE